MKVIPLAALMLAGCSAGQPRTGGIVSTNPCADAMLAELAPEKLAAISHYSHDPRASSLSADVAARYQTTAGTAEEVIARAPDLVVTSSFTPAATRAAYERAGLRMLTLDSPTSVGASEGQVMKLADAVSEHGRGKAIVADIENALHSVRVEGRRETCSVAQRVPTSARRAEACPERLPCQAVEGLGPNGRGCQPSVLLYLSGDLASGGGTLLDDLMTRAGLRDAAVDYGLAHTGRIPLETIVAHPPDLILSPDPDSRQARRRAEVLGDRVAERLFPRRLVNCGGPVIIPALEQLAAARKAVR